MAMESTLKLKESSTAPNFKLSGTDGKTHSLSDFRGKKALLVIFMCNHCPYVQAKMQIMNELFAKFRNRGVAFVGINSNDPVSYPDDSSEKMKSFAHERGIQFDYLFDGTQEVAKAYGAACTPDPFLFDGNFKLVYHGRFNDALSPSAVPTTRDMDDALEAVVQGRKPPKFFLPSVGCSIKWKYNK